MHGLRAAFKVSLSCLSAQVGDSFVPVPQRISVIHEEEHAVNLVDISEQSPFADHARSDLLCLDGADL